MAAGGAMSLAGEPDGMPVRISEPQSGAWTGAQAACGALFALYSATRPAAAILSRSPRKPAS